MNLFLTIAWLEMHRVRKKFIFLFTLALFSTVVAGKCSASFSLQTNGIAPSSVLDRLFQLMPQLYQSSVVLIIGLALLLAMTLGTRSEFESGPQQMVIMGDFPPLKIAYLVHLFYFLVGLIFFSLLIAPGVYYAVKVQPDLSADLGQVIVLCAYLFLTVVPLLLALGQWLSSLQSSYARDRKGFLLSLCSFLGSFALGLLFIRLGSYLWDLEVSLLPRLALAFHSSGDQAAFSLRTELPLVSLLAAALLIFWAGRIDEEVEY